MMWNDAGQREGESLEARLRREAGAYRPRVGRELELRWHRALVEAQAARTKEVRRGMPWPLMMFAAGTAVAGLAVILAVTKPSAHCAGAAANGAGSAAADTGADRSGGDDHGYRGTDSEPHESGDGCASERCPAGAADDGVVRGERGRTAGESRNVKT